MLLPLGISRCEVLESIPVFIPMHHRTRIVQGGRSEPISLFILALSSVGGGRGVLISWFLPPKPSDAKAHRVFTCRSCVIPNLDAMLTLTRGHDIARASSNKVVVGGSVATQTIHRPVGIGVTRNGGDEVGKTNHWMIP